MKHFSVLAQAKGVWRIGKFIRSTAKTIPLTAFIAVLLCGCATTTTSMTPVTPKPSIVIPGDQVDVHFTCRLRNGEIVASSYEEVGRDSSLPKSRVFIPRKMNTPIPIKAERNLPVPDKPGEGGLEGEILRQLSVAAVGREIGKKQAVEIRAERLPEQTKGEWVAKIARVRERPKEMRFTPEEYKAKTGNEPQLGRTFIHDPALPGKVEVVNEKEVIVRFAPQNGTEVMTPFGKGNVRELPDRYEIVIDAQPGSLVRTAALVGRIVDVDDREITIDYSDPFGGEPLLCDLLVESVKLAAQ